MDDQPQPPELVAHERTYKAFNVLLRWVMVGLGSSLLLLTIWFATPGGFLGGFAAGLVAFVAGYFLLIRHERRQPLDVWAGTR